MQLVLRLQSLTHTAGIRAKQEDFWSASITCQAVLELLSLLQRNSSQHFHMM